MAVHRVPRLDMKSTLLFVCDMQEKFSKTNKFFPEIAQTATRVISAARILDIPIVVTEHYPKGLGSTVPELEIPSSVLRYPKTQFSMCIPEVVPLLNGRKSVILVGVEAHVCILHTTYDLIEKGIDVHVVVDAVTARNLVDRKFAFKQLERVGAVLTTSECVLLGLLKDAAHPKFKEVQKLVMSEAPESGLMDIFSRIYNNMASRMITRLSPKNSVLFVCDMQERFSKTIAYFPAIVQTAKRLVDAARILDIPIVVTEQYPKGLGHTVPELGLADEKKYPKTRFSMCVPELDVPSSNNVILVGIEAHACVLQTTLDLIEKGKTVHVVVDAVSSRSLADR
ncbi:unnamed protein product [Nippostrongylus brasiliensis]|uniref:Isochorismatase domain-containing protein 1 n=1 Tax=Nippostrongylus brasiliensis TaxID=27835 RepID=A0A0N4YRU9_NIPBR|nr:unnamed protein product [Nippostrongylus brasiliensis]